MAPFPKAFFKPSVDFPTSIVNRALSLAGVGLHQVFQSKQAFLRFPNLKGLLN